MKSTAPVSKIMTKELVTLQLTDDLYLAEKLFKTHKIRHLPVLDGKHLAGILSYTDLLRISYADLTAEEDTIETVVYDMFTVSQVMMNRPVVVSSETSIHDVAKILSEREFHALPVIDNNRLVGIVTTTDLIKYFLKNCPEFKNAKC
ncbi:MAG: CBS domain-containing protein [Flavobacteriales bacterium CG_4_9_14_3_um_filter_40_17]|nr:MAG: CBS domain-containing protein [Flavobacteriales bacterium CG_4_9_14_3_um_filter_40_17]